VFEIAILINVLSRLVRS